MPGRQAKLLSETMIRRAHKVINRRPTALRDRVLLLLSVRAGLRACEIAGLDWSMVTEPNGRIAKMLLVHDRIAKKGGGRRIPMHDELRQALTAYAATVKPVGALLPSRRTGGHLRANSVVNWFIDLLARSARPDVRRTQVVAPSSPWPPAALIGPALRFAMCSCWRGIARSR